MFGFFRRKPKVDPVVADPKPDQLPSAPVVDQTMVADPEPTLVQDLTPTTIQAPATMTVAVATVVAEPQVAAPVAERAGWFKRLQSGLSKTRGNLSGLFSRVKIDDELYEALETALIVSDAGITTANFVLTQLKEQVRRERLTDASQVKAALKVILVDILRPMERAMDIDRANPLVIMISGVNGAGKTTSIGKLTHHLQREGKSVLLAAGDTFRAAAREQLAEWGKRNQVTVIAQEGGDPAAVAFDAVTAAAARGLQTAIIDTAGRLPTQAHLMQELAKIRRVVGKANPDAPHESLLVLDGNTGQNMVPQVAAFDAVVNLTGLIVTKLDGTAKGGALIALARARLNNPIPIYFIGVGEGVDDLQAFSADEFVAALID